MALLPKPNKYYYVPYITPQKAEETAKTSLFVSPYICIHTIRGKRLEISHQTMSNLCTFYQYLSHDPLYQSKYVINVGVANWT